MATVYAKIPINGFDGYTPLQIAKGLQREFFRISSPPEVRDPADVTEYLAGWITHPQTGQLAIILPDISVTKHNLASAERLIDFLKDVVNDTKKDQVCQYWQNNGAINIQQIWEYLFSAQTLTHEEMEAEGWFATDEI